MEDSIASTDDSFFYKVGADFCLSDPPDPLPFGNDPIVVVAISCVLLNGEDVLPRAFPPPDRIWSKDGVTLYQEDTTILIGDTVVSQEFETSFPALFESLRTFFIIGIDGDLRFLVSAYNLSNPVVVAAYEELFGEWTCLLNNSLGMESATTVVRRCGELL